MILYYLGTLHHTDCPDLNGNKIKYYIFSTIKSNGKIGTFSNTEPHFKVF